MRNNYFILLLLILSFFNQNIFADPISKNPKLAHVKTVKDEVELKEKIESIKKWIINNPQYNAKYIFLIDMKIMSGKNRFFVFDLEKDKIIDQGLVAHGVGSDRRIDGKLKFSNVNNSLCTSLGKYAIGKSYTGVFGKSYKLHGLDSTNSNAIRRNIVLHKYDKLPNNEQGFPIANSFGCPMVSKEFYVRLEKLIDKSKGKIILEIYY